MMVAGTKSTLLGSEAMGNYCVPDPVDLWALKFYKSNAAKDLMLAGPCPPYAA